MSTEHSPLLDDAVVERLRRGEGTRSDHISKLEFWRTVAAAYGDYARVAVLDQEIVEFRAT